MKLPKGKIGEARFTGETASPLPVLPDGTPVTEFVIFAPGTNESDYGPVEFDAIAAAFVMSNQEEKANPLYFDFNHGMAQKYATAEQGKSGGTFDLEVRDGALMAVHCTWTEEAFERITKREYNLFSPWFGYIDSDDGVRRPYRMFNVAILNVAGLNGIQQLAAGSAATEESDMTAEEIKRLQDRNTVLEAEVTTLRAASTELAALGGTLALGANAGHAERTGAVTGLLSLRAEVHKIAGKGTDAEALGVLEANKEKAKQADGLIAAAAKAETDALTAELNVVLDDGIKAAKIKPALREVWEAAALAKGAGKPSKEGILYLRAKIDASGKEVSTEEVGQKRQPKEITPAGKVVAVQMGVKLDELELFNTDREAWEKQVREASKPTAAGAR